MCSHELFIQMVILFTYIFCHLHYMLSLQALRSRLKHHQNLCGSVQMIYHHKTKRICIGEHF